MRGFGGEARGGTARGRNPISNGGRSAATRSLVRSPAGFGRRAVVNTPPSSVKTIHLDSLTEAALGGGEGLGTKEGNSTWVEGGWGDCALGGGGWPGTQEHGRGQQG